MILGLLNVQGRIFYYYFISNVFYKLVHHRARKASAKRDRHLRGFKRLSNKSLESLPQDFVQKEMNGVVGFVVDVTRVDAGYKLSQNRNDADHENIVGELEARRDEQSVGVAKAMREGSERQKNQMALKRKG